ncbi:hypothetical protein [Kineococcus esterisolvens]|uniref:hypothetical protein n=1 Tax=unclassified Kineococcus TaxID=2621656 RepID=UPI003D7EBE71
MTAEVHDPEGSALRAVLSWLDGFVRTPGAAGVAAVIGAVVAYRTAVDKLRVEQGHNSAMERNAAFQRWMQVFDAATRDGATPPATTVAGLWSSAEPSQHHLLDPFMTDEVRSLVAATEEVNEVVLATEPTSDARRADREQRKLERRIAKEAVARWIVEEEEKAMGLGGTSRRRRAEPDSPQSR